MLEDTGKEARYYLQDELGSPIRLMDQNGELTESYGYDEFGRELYWGREETAGRSMTGSIQPFGYTGYQYDRTAGTCYAQAREYRAEMGRFAAVDIIKGFAAAPYTLNEYGYCWNNPMALVDRDGRLPEWLENIGETVEEGWDALCNGASYVWNNYIYGEEVTNVKIDISSMDDWYNAYTKTVITETTHQGGSIIVRQRQQGAIVSDGYTIGIPRIVNVGITVGPDGINISRFLGVENIFESYGNINIGSSSIVEFDSKLEVGWNGNMIGYGSSFGVSPISQVKVYGISEMVNDKGENVYIEVGGYIRTGLVYAFVASVALVYGILSSSGTMVEVLLPIYNGSIRD